jgi:hypothetical protein
MRTATVHLRSYGSFANRCHLNAVSDKYPHVADVSIPISLPKLEVVRQKPGVCSDLKFGNPEIQRPTQSIVWKYVPQLNIRETPGQNITYRFRYNTKTAYESSRFSLSLRLSY